MRSEFGTGRPRRGSGLGILIILIAGGAVAFFLFKGNASINKMEFSGLGRRDPICFLELEFHKIPKEGNPQDVKVVFTSEALAQDASFDWKHIGDNAFRNKKKGFGRTKVEGFASNKDPLLGVPINVGFPLTAKKTLEPGKSFMVKAEFFWAGRKQGTRKKSMRYMYKKEGKAF